MGRARISVVVGALTFGCKGGQTVAAPTGSDATPEARAVADPSDATSSSPGSGSSSEGGLDEASGMGDMSASEADAPMEGAADAVCDPGPPCPTPVFCPSGGSIYWIVAGGVTITTPGFPQATIYYTTDGTMPTHSSAVYNGPVINPDVLAVIHAIAFEPCVCPDSRVGTATFDSALPVDGEAPDCGARD